MVIQTRGIMGLRRLSRKSSGLLKGECLVPQRVTAADCMQTDVVRTQEHPLFSPHGWLQRNLHLARHMTSFSLLPIRATHALSLANVCDAHCLHDHLACSDNEILEAAVALENYIQKTTLADATAIAAVVDHAPSFVKHLVAAVKLEASNEEKVDAGDSQLVFYKQVQKLLDTVGINVLEPVLESIGITREHLRKVLVKLSSQDVDMQSLFFLIRTFEKLGVSRRSVGSIIRKDAQVLSYSSEEIEVGIRLSKALMISEVELQSLVHQYPLIFKAELMNNIIYLREELREFISKDCIVKQAVCSNPQRVHTYRRGCATQVMNFLRSYDFTIKRLDRILQKYPRLVLTDVETNLNPNVRFLEGLGLSKASIFKVINRCPKFLLYSVDDNLMAKLEYFKELGFDESEFCQVVCGFPNLLSVSTENKIKPALAELRTHGLSEEGLKKVVLFRPCLFGYKVGGDISALVKQVNEGSQSEGKKVTTSTKRFFHGTEHKKRCEDCLVRYGLSTDEAKEVMEKEPGLLGYNEDALSERLESLTNTYGIPIQSVLAVPEYLSFGLRKRVQRRQRVLSYMKSKGLMTGALNLKQMVLLSNSQFYNHFVKSHSEDKKLSKIWFEDPG